MNRKIVISSPVSRTGHLDTWVQIVSSILGNKFPHQLVISNQFSSYRKKKSFSNSFHSIIYRRWEASFYDYVSMLAERLINQPKRVLYLFYRNSVPRNYRLVRPDSPRSLVWHALRTKTICCREGFSNAPVLLLFFDHFRVTQSELLFFNDLFPAGWGALCFQNESLTVFSDLKLNNNIGVYSPALTVLGSKYFNVKPIEELIVSLESSDFNSASVPQRPRKKVSKVFGYFGPLVSRKGFPQFVEFAEILLGEGWEVIVIGEQFDHTPAEALGRLLDLKENYRNSVFINLEYLDSDQKYLNYFISADLIWAGYTDEHTGSSNLVSMASAYGKSVLITQGLIRTLGVSILKSNLELNLLKYGVSADKLIMGIPEYSDQNIRNPGWAELIHDFQSFMNIKTNPPEVIVYGGSSLALNFLKLHIDKVRVVGLLAKSISKAIRHYRVHRISSLTVVKFDYILICSVYFNQIIREIKESYPDVSFKIINYPNEFWIERNTGLSLIKRVFIVGILFSCILGFLIPI